MLNWKATAMLERVRKDTVSGRRKELTSFELRQREKTGYSTARHHDIVEYNYRSCDDTIQGVDGNIVYILYNLFL